MTVILALDPSLTATGWTVGTPNNGTPHIGTITTNPPTNEQRLLTIASQIRQLVRHHQPTIVALEDLAYGAKGAGLTALAGLHWTIRCMLHGQHVRPLVVASTAIKKYATGAGNAKKDDVYAAAIRRLNYTGNSRDEADALWLYALVADALNSPIIDMPKTNRQAAHTLANDLTERIPG
jgi:crossover junction endodeoxyribonuclease RuvC